MTAENSTLPNHTPPPPAAGISFAAGLQRLMQRAGGEHFRWCLTLQPQRIDWDAPDDVPPPACDCGLAADIALATALAGLIERLEAAVRQKDSAPFDWPRDRAGRVKIAALRDDAAMLGRRVQQGDVIEVAARSGPIMMLVPVSLIDQLAAGFAVPSPPEER